MAFPDLVKGTYVAIQAEDPNNAGSYIDLCGLTTKTFTRQVNTRDRFTRDCADPENIPVRVPVATGRQWDLAGSGAYNRAQAALIGTLEGVIANYRYYIGEPVDDAVYESYWAGAGMLSQVQMNGNDDDDANIDLTFLSSGLWTETEV